jgi:hypothetical protein
MYSKSALGRNSAGIAFDIGALSACNPEVAPTMDGAFVRHTSMPSQQEGGFAQASLHMATSSQPHAQWGAGGQIAKASYASIPTSDSMMIYHTVPPTLLAQRTSAAFRASATIPRTTGHSDDTVSQNFQIVDERSPPFSQHSSGTSSERPSSGILFADKSQKISLVDSLSSAAEPFLSNETIEATSSSKKGQQGLAESTPAVVVHVNNPAPGKSHTEHRIRHKKLWKECSRGIETQEKNGMPPFGPVFVANGTSCEWKVPLSFSKVKEFRGDIRGTNHLPEPVCIGMPGLLAIWSIFKIEVPLST